MASENISERDWLNGFSGVVVKRLPGGEWVIGRSFRAAHVLPSPEWALRLRRRSLAVLALWAPGVVLLWWVGSPIYVRVLYAAALVPILMVAHREVARLPVASYRFSRREFLFQLRGLFLFMAALNLVAGTLALNYGMPRLGVLACLTGLALLAVGGWAWGYAGARTPEG